MGYTPFRGDATRRESCSCPRFVGIFTCCGSTRVGVRRLCSLLKPLFSSVAAWHSSDIQMVLCQWGWVHPCWGWVHPCGAAGVAAFVARRGCFVHSGHLKFVGSDRRRSGPMGYSLGYLLVSSFAASVAVFGALARLKFHRVRPAVGTDEVFFRGCYCRCCFFFR